MNNFGSLQGRVYELGGLTGSIRALQHFTLSDVCKEQMARVISRLARVNLAKIHRQFCKETDCSMLGGTSVTSALRVLSARLFQGYVQGFCETKQFVKSVAPGRPMITWFYANPVLDPLEPGNAPVLLRKELSLIANVSDIDLSQLSETGTCPFADVLFIVRAYHDDAYRFHLVGYELSTHNTPTIDTELNLSHPYDIYESLKRGKSAMTNAIRTRDFRIASETLGLEISRDLKDYFRGLLTHDKIAKKLFQGGGYVHSLYETLKDRVRHDNGFEKWKAGKGHIEFHIVAFTDRNRHFLHVREDESELLREMGIIYKGIRHGSSLTRHEERQLREMEIRKTHDAVLRNIRKNTSSPLRASLKGLYDRAAKTFLNRQPLPDYLDYAFTENIGGYCPTGTPPTQEQLETWIPLKYVEKIRQAKPLSMQDAHAQIVRSVWEEDPSDIYVLSGTPGIGKTTALRNILSDYDRGYVLVYVSPRLQVNADLMAKFDPADERNCSVGKAEMICVTTNSSLIRAAEHYHGKPALTCCCHDIPDDPKFLFLSQDAAESLESQSLDNQTKFSQNRTGYKVLEEGGVGEGCRSPGQGVFKTMMQAVHRLNTQYDFKRIIACVSTQSNVQLARDDTTFSKNLSKMFGNTRELHLASVEKFARNVKEVIFFIDEVTGDRAGRQTAQEVIAFRKHIDLLFREVGKSCPLKFRIVIADASLINASSVETYLSKTTSQPDQILFNGNADQKGLSVEETKLMRLPGTIVNANVYPASRLTLRWRPVLGFSDTRSRGCGKDTVSQAYQELEDNILAKLAEELVQRWHQRPREQTLVIIQNRASVETLREYVLAHANARKLGRPDIVCLHAQSPVALKRRIVTPARDQEKEQKKREVPISHKGDLDDIVIMTSSGTRGISFPNASKIVCIIPTFSLENNFMEFLQGIYRGRGRGKGNRLDREIEIIIPQVLVSPPADPDDSGSLKAKQAAQIANLFATQMIMRMSIFTRIFGASDLFGKSVSCIPIAGCLVRGAAQTTMDTLDNAIRALEYAHKQDLANTDIRYVKEEIRDIFKHETVVLRHNLTRGHRPIISGEYRNRLLNHFAQDANKGLDVLANGDYLPEGCHTVGELILQNLEEIGVKEKDKHLVDTHLEGTRKKIRALCAKLNHLADNKDTVKTVRDSANALLPVMRALSQVCESDTESETEGSALNRWLVVPISAMHIDSFWKGRPDADHFKAEMKKMLEHYVSAYLCRPHFVLPLQHSYDKAPPWLLVRGPEISQRIHAQFQTRYFISSKALALLNIMLLGKTASIKEKGGRNGYKNAV